MTENKRVTPNLPKSMLNPSPAYVWQNSEHNLRRFRASQWIRLGLDKETVMKLLGHRDMRTTERYIRSLDPDLSRVREVQAQEDLVGDTA
jgi:integrase